MVEQKIVYFSLVQVLGVQALVRTRFLNVDFQGRQAFTLGRLAQHNIPALMWKLILVNVGLLMGKNLKPFKARKV